MLFPRNKIKALGAFLLLNLGLGYLLYLPANFFDEGQSICLSVVLLDTKCYGCGMTRGVQHLIHGDFTAAWEFNKLAFIVLPLLVFMLLWEIYKVLSSKETEAPSEK